MLKAVIDQEGQAILQREAAPQDAADGAGEMLRVMDLNQVRHPGRGSGGVIGHSDNWRVFEAVINQGDQAMGQREADPPGCG